MRRETIDYGIDLGTTNSEIARLNGTAVEVFRNAEGFEYTPSAVWEDKQGKLVVGRLAKEWHERDPGNAFIEFKRHMGTCHDYTFARSGRKMKPEELSAEVLKSLRADVERRTGEAITAAVVTVPADFDLPACEATKRAASLAGLQHCLLLQEPVAAAQAYSFEREEDKTFWLVYDFGGGTFDAAIIQVRDGLIQVVGHGGDNQLGGKNLDWAIVEQLFIPALLKERSLTDFGRHNPAKWGGAIAKLKIQAEEAKIRLSAPGVDSTEVQIDFLCKDDRGEPVEFYYELKRSELERLAEPFIRRTLHICKETLAERRLAPGNIAKVILVGGPTLMPFLRQQLQDPAEGLGIPLEFNVDPLTVVARGAAVFAGGQRLPDEHWAAQVRPGHYAVKLDYTPVGPDTDPPVAGVVSAGEGVEKDFTGFTIEFINPDIRPPWRSGKIGLGPKGNFMTTVCAEKGRANTFQIELRDPTGALQELGPNSFQITVKGVGAVQITLPHAIGVALANNEVVQFFDKGTVIPARKRRDLHTALALQRGQSGQFLRVPVVEGNKIRADRNRLIGTLLIPAEKVARDVPAGSDIEVTIEIDQSRLIRTKAFIPILDDEFEDVLKLESAVPDAKQLAERLRRAKDRLKTVRQKADAAGDSQALELLRQIDSECMVPEAERLVAAAVGDSDAARQCLNLLNSLESTLDDAEDALEWPTLVTEAEKVLEDTRQVVETSQHATAEDERNLAALERETREAIEHRVPDLLRRRLEGLQALRAGVALRDPGPWLYELEELKENRAAMSDPALAERLFAQADRAVQNNDFAGLRTAVVQLLRLSGERLKEQFDDLKAARARMTDQARAAALIAAGERALAENDMAELARVIHQLKLLLPGVTL